MAMAESDASLDGRPMGPGDRIRTEVAEAHEALLRSITLMITGTSPGLSQPQVMEKAGEILGEAVEQALIHADRFDPARSVTAWIRGIAARLLLARRRTEARDRRCIPAAVLGAEAWSSALERILTDAGDAAVVHRLDLEQALDRIKPEERRAIELRYYQALDGADLARALGVSSAGAARVRVCRALQSLRAEFANDEKAEP